MAKQEPSAFTGMTENMSSLSDASVDLTEEKYYMWLNWNNLLHLKTIKSKLIIWWKSKWFLWAHNKLVTFNIN